MAIKTNTGFQIGSEVSIDSRITLTTEEMLNVNDNTQPSRYFAINQDDGQLYLYNKEAEPNAATGKFKKIEADGGAKVWQGTKAEYEAAVEAGTIPVDTFIIITDDEEESVAIFKNVTQEEYDALPDDKLTDGIAYIISEEGDTTAKFVRNGKEISGGTEVVPNIEFDYTDKEGNVLPLGGVKVMLARISDSSDNYFDTKAGEGYKFYVGDDYFARYSSLNNVCLVIVGDDVVVKAKGATIGVSDQTTFESYLTDNFGTPSAVDGLRPLEVDTLQIDGAAYRIVGQRYIGGEGILISLDNQISLTNPIDIFTPDSNATTVTVGGVPKGYDFTDKEYTINEVLNMIFFPYVAFTYTTLAGGGSYEYGKEVTISKVTPTYEAGSKAITTVSVGTTADGNDLYEGISYTSGAITLTTSKTFDGTTGGKVYCTLSDGTTTLEQSTTVSYVKSIYYATSARATEAPTSGTKGNNIDITVAADNYIYFLCPDKTKTQIQQYAVGQWNDVDTTYVGEVAFTNSEGAALTYHAYRTNQLAAMTGKFQIK